MLANGLVAQRASGLENLQKRLFSLGGQLPEVSANVKKAFESGKVFSPANADAMPAVPKHDPASPISSGTKEKTGSQKADSDNYRDASKFSRVNPSLARSESSPSLPDNNDFDPEKSAINSGDVGNHDFDGGNAGPTASFMKTFAGYAAGALVQGLIFSATSVVYRATSGIPILNTVLPIAIGSLVDNMVATRMQGSQAKGVDMSAFSQGMQMAAHLYQSRMQAAMQHT